MLETVHCGPPAAGRTSAPTTPTLPSTMPAATCGLTSKHVGLAGGRAGRQTCRRAGGKAAYGAYGYHCMCCCCCCTSALLTASTRGRPCLQLAACGHRHCLGAAVDCRADPDFQAAGQAPHSGGVWKGGCRGKHHQREGPLVSTLWMLAAALQHAVPAYLPVWQLPGPVICPQSL